MPELATVFDLIKLDYGQCADCERETKIEPRFYRGAWFAVVICADCGEIAEIEIASRNEAAILY